MVRAALGNLNVLTYDQFRNSMATMYAVDESRIEGMARMIEVRQQPHEHPESWFERYLGSCNSNAFMIDSNAGEKLDDFASRSLACCRRILEEKKTGSLVEAKRILREHPHTHTQSVPVLAARAQWGAADE